MNRLCPKCRMPALHPLSLNRLELNSSHVPPPSRCEKCRGVWLPHEAVHEGLVPAAAEVADLPTPQAADADERAGFCPAGHGLMRRARVEAGGTALHLDRCVTCLGTWFDAGEWSIIASSRWLQHLDDLWDPVFRKKMRDATAREHYLGTLRQALGEEAFLKVIAAGEAIRSHPMRSVALAYLLEEAQAHLPEA